MSLCMYGLWPLEDPSPLFTLSTLHFTFSSFFMYLSFHQPHFFNRLFTIFYHSSSLSIFSSASLSHCLSINLFVSLHLFICPKTNREEYIMDLFLHLPIFSPHFLCKFSLIHFQKLFNHLSSSAFTSNSSYIFSPHSSSISSSTCLFIPVLCRFDLIHF